MYVKLQLDKNQKILMPCCKLFVFERADERFSESQIAATLQV